MNAISRYSGRLDAWDCDWRSSLPRWVGDVEYTLELPANFPTCWLGIVSSHTHQFGYASAVWQKALTSAIQLAQRQAWGVFFATQTPYAATIAHHCLRSSVPAIHLSCFRRRSQYEQAVKELASRQPCPLRANLLAIELDGTGDKPATNDEPIKKSIAVHDRIAVALPNQVFVVAMREGGKIATLVRDRLNDPIFPKASIHIARQACDLDHSTKAKSNSVDWFAMGAIACTDPKDTLEDERRDALCRNSSSNCDTHPPATYALLTHTRFLKEGERYLVHCTRARRGPWPDQSSEQFQDELMQFPWRSWPTPFENLVRIMRQQRLIATQHLKRGPLATVCFSDRMLAEILRNRRFQSHLHRWDWEPYGIMIDKEWLRMHGARPVRYGEPAKLRNLDSEELAYAQPTNRDSEGGWQEEREWRIAGDVLLANLPYDKGLVFVQHQSEARTLQSLSRWPIVYVVADREEVR